MSKPALRWPLAAFATVMSALFKSCTAIDQFHIAPIPEARNRTFSSEAKVEFKFQV